MLGEQLQQYRITAKLGQGGMGVVYRARDLRLERDVAIKVLPASGADHVARQRFLLEARAASALNHPGIVTIYEVNSDHGMDFIAMEFVQGLTLRQMVQQNTMTMPLAFDCVLQIAGALAAAHRAGIVHRDLKPANVMVTDAGVVKILDFGIAKRSLLHAAQDDDATMQPMTREGSFMGTIGYLSPEQARGEGVDGRSDVFALSVILYELVAGVRPFTGVSTIAVLNSLANDEPRPVASLRPDVPAGLDRILRRGLAKRCDDRYPSMEELAADVRLMTSGQGLSLGEPGVLNTPHTRVVVHVPRVRNPFLGRTAELAELDRLFAEPRIVTIVASGGTGKTRLAYEAATLLSDRFPSGVFAVELADGGSADVPIRLAAAALGHEPLARTEGTTDPVGAVEAYLESRRALLIIDNCEHVIGVTRDIVARLARRCAKLSILNTSREVLGVPGEHVLSLRPLGLSPAVALFHDRAEAADANFTLDTEQSAAIEAICRRLEGVPLAIELAASRVRTLRPTQMAARLSDALKLLRQRSAGDQDRHRSLEAAIRWSYDLLDDAERALLARMAVFVGGFDLAAAEGVGGDVLDLVESLVDKSLVVADVGGDTIRYRLQEPIRQFAAERLEDMGQVPHARRAHCAYYLHLAQSTVPQLDEAPRPALVAALSREHENFLAAIDRAQTDGDLAAAALLSRTLHTYWVETGHVAVGARVLGAMVEANPGDPSMLPQLGTLVALESMSGALDRAERRAGVLRALLAGPIPDVVAGNVRFALGFVESAAGRSARAYALWREAAQQLRGDPTRARVVWLSAGNAATSAGRLDDARESYSQAEACPPPAQGWFPAFLAFNRAVTDVLDGGRDLAPLERGLEELERLGLRFRLLLAAAAGCHAFFIAGHIEAADRWWRRGLDLGRDMGHLWACWLTLEFAAWSAAASGDDHQAARLWGAVDAFAAARGYGHWEVIRETRTARINQVRSRDPEAYRVAAAEGAAVPLSRLVEEAPRLLGRSRVV